MELDNLTFRYKKSNKDILKNLNINFDPNKLNVLVGLNGAGKTTLLDIIAGLQPIEQNQLLFKQNEIMYQMQGIGYPVNLRGREIVELLLKCDSPKLYSQKLQILKDSLTEREKELFYHLWDSQFGNMSLGERRWLIIKTICCLERNLYIFDEPTAGIDPDTRKHVISSISHLSAKGKLVVMSTHILHELEFVECKIHFLHQGKILFVGDYTSFMEKYHTKNPDEAFQYFIQEYKEDI